MKKINLVRDNNHGQSVLSDKKIKTRRILSSSKSFLNRKQKKENLTQCASLYGLSSKKIFLSFKPRKPLIISEGDRNEQKRKFLESSSISQGKQSLLLKLNEFKIDINIEELKNQKPSTQKAVRKKYQTGRMMKSCLSCQNNLKASSSTPKNNERILNQKLVKSQASSIIELRNRENGPVIFCPFFWQNQREIKNRVDRIRHIRKIQFKDNFITV